MRSKLHKRKPGFIAVRSEVFKKIKKDPWWSKELEATRTTEQLIEVIEAYCQEKGFKVKQMS